MDHTGAITPCFLCFGGLTAPLSDSRSQGSSQVRFGHIQLNVHLLGHVLLMELTQLLRRGKVEEEEKKRSNLDPVDRRLVHVLPEERETQRSEGEASDLLRRIRHAKVALHPHGSSYLCLSAATSAARLSFSISWRALPEVSASTCRRSSLSSSW
ncbi:hypothetical protein EYF80_053166 [Liparis tanakae]|uniref:Uncharacterized protein n=1 Tax=Liparis tanakae TaxID=230148 RepID=A0A4Z2F685_9TELE|nr:hypothetical protein EYF80_053166 [Liparis tanakae]